MSIILSTQNVVLRKVFLITYYVIKKIHITLQVKKYEYNTQHQITLHIYYCHYSVRMDSHQAHRIEYSGTVELQMLIGILLWDRTSLFLKEYTYFLRSSLNEGMLKHTNISLALLYFGMPNNFLKLLLYDILKVFNAVLEQSYHNMEQYKLE